MDLNTRDRDRSDEGRPEGGGPGRARVDPTAAVRFGLIGTGRIGRLHAANIHASADAELVVVADPVRQSAEQVAAACGAVATDSAAELIGRGDLDAVLIASPTATHVELIGRAVRAGIPVLCEKPIDLDITRVDRLRAEVAAAGVPVLLGFNRRFDPAFREVRDRVAAGELGELEQLVIVSRDPAPPSPEYLASSGGLFRDMTIHDLDMARFFLPDIVEVHALGSTLFDDGARRAADVDTAVVTLRAATGATVTIVNSRHSAVGYDQRLEAFGARGSLQVTNAHRGLVSRSGADVVEARAPYQDFFLDRYAQAYAAELADMIALVRGGASAAATFEDGRAALVLADAAQRSATERVVVPVALGRAEAAAEGA